MNSEVIKAVRDAEQSADELLRNARLRAKEIAAEAQAKAEAAAAAEHARTREKIQARLETARAEAAAEVAGFMESNRSEGEALKAAARLHLNEARDYIIGRIVK